MKLQKIWSITSLSQLSILVLLILTLLPIAYGAESDSVKKLKFRVSEIKIQGDNPLSQPKNWKKLLSSYIGDQQSLSEIQKAARALQALLYEKGFTSHRVIIPQQTLQNGVVYLKIIAFRVGNIKVTGNKYFSADRLLASLPEFHPGTIPNTKKLSRQLLLANENPAKRLSIKFKQSNAERIIDATIKVDDQPPISFFSILNNHSSNDTPNLRLTVGLQHANVLGRDHVFTGTYTTAPEDFSWMTQYGLNYSIPLFSMGGSLSTHFASTDTDNGIVQQFFGVSGKGQFTGIKYKQHLARKGNYTSSLTVGLDDRLFENNTTFVNTPIGKNVRSRPITLRYDNTYRSRQGTTDFYIGFSKNLTSGSHNNKESYTNGTDPNWASLELGGNINRVLHRKWRFRSELNAQFSNEPLISGEQFGIGGASSVRGFDERYVTGDTGASLNLEVISPPISKGIYAVGFTDLGYIKEESVQGNTSESTSLSSVGVGLRGSWKNISAQLDLAYPLKVNSGDIDEGDIKLHLNLVWRNSL